MVVNAKKEVSFKTQVCHRILLNKFNQFLQKKVMYKTFFKI